MNVHKNARTTPFSRALMVERRAAGLPVAQIAADLGVSVRTVCKWLRRYREEGRAGLETRSSRARTHPHATPAAWIAMVERLRRLRLTAYEIAERLNLARSTVSAILARLGLGRLTALAPTPPVVRYERAAPGDMLHLDIKKLARFDRPGHRVTGARKGRNAHVGYDFVHVCVDDHSRVAYVEVLSDEKGRTCAGFLIRALKWFRARGVAVARVMTDNGAGYISKRFARALRWAGARHVRTKPYTPKTNGKAERFIQTLMREWAYAFAYRSADARTADLPRWLNHYNAERPHAGIQHQPPLSRMPNTW